ncbi:hypothetical protein MKX64_08840 [Paenibacillus sp. FSL M8-0334]|uniref:hypothetical protein n=1 Tax=Paenibacillus sp. FSL M8-0334 TaxID=2921623 RepID=UPI0030F873DE
MDNPNVNRIGQRQLSDVVERMVPPGLHFYYPDGDGPAFWQRVRESKAYATDVAEIKAEGEHLLGQAVPELTYALFSLFAKQGSRLEYERVYFERRRRLNTFALLGLLEPEREDYVEELLNAVWAICSELTWCLPAHVGERRPVADTIDLFSAETGFTLAELTLLLGDRLPKMLKAHILELVHRRLLLPFLEKGPYEWEEAEHNWAAVCAGSIGAASLLLLQEEREQDLLIRILEKTERSMACYLKGFGEDGGCLEGLGYWNYGFGYFVYYADLLFKRTQGELDWFSLEKVEAIAGFQQKCFLGGNAVVNFSDSFPHEQVQLGLSRYLAGRYDSVQSPPSALRADYRKDHCSRWAPALRNLMWREQAGDVPDWPPRDYMLEDAGWLISRTVSSAGIFGFAAKGGHNDEPHNHLDLGQFMLAGDGEFYLSDLGCGEYTKGYFSAGRYVYDCNGAQGHSVPIVNGCLQAAGRQRKASVVEQAITGQEARLTIELAAAYECPSLQSLRRTWRWHKHELPCLELKDVFVLTDRPDALLERFVTLIRPEQAEDDEGQLLLDRGTLALKLAYDRELLRLEVTERIWRNHDGEDEVWYTLDFHVLRPERHVELDFIFQFVRR